MKLSASAFIVLLVVISEAYGRTTLERQRRSPLFEKGVNLVKDINSRINPFAGRKDTLKPEEAKPEGAKPDENPLIKEVDTSTPKLDTRESDTSTPKLDKDGYPNPDPEIVRPGTFTPKPERGHFSGFARDGLTKVTKVISAGVSRVGKIFSPNSGGLDTEPSFFSKISSPFTGAAKVASNEFMSRVNSIYPGTKWCGGGNVSDTDERLGLFANTDQCCREHDKCPDNMQAGEVRNGLHNKGLFTRSHCSCDTKFYDCLKKNIISPISNSIGITYFNIIGPQCYREDYPISGCKNWVVTASNLTKCTEYEFNKAAGAVYQWFDNKLFYGLPELDIY